MPYVVINSYPRDEKTKQAMADKVSAAMQEALGCPEKSLTIAINEITPADWENIRDNEIPKKMDSIMILSGEKKYKKD